MNALSADLNTVWFLLVGVLLTGYAILDGFDLGVGALHLWVKEDHDRRVLMNAIGPVWDGNEVWLVTGGGALFAAFPLVYAEIFSGFYLAFVLLLFMLIARAVSMEFRSKQPARSWRRTWDLSFAVGSVGASLLMGVALGNVAFGIPLSAEHRYEGGLLGLLGPYPLLVGLTTVTLFAMHGGLYLLLKTEGPLQERIRVLLKRAYWGFVASYVATTAATLVLVPRLILPFREAPWLWGIPALTVLLIANILRDLRGGRDRRAFLSSCASITFLMLVLGIGLYPTMVPSTSDPSHSLTIYNAASSPRTLTIMLIIAGIGFPVVLGYTAFIYRVFKGKVKLDSSSY